MDHWFGDRDYQLMGKFDSLNETCHWTLWLLLELVFVVVVLGSLILIMSSEKYLVLYYAF